MVNWGGGASGAMQGAQMGSMIMPGWGTAIGAGIGGIAGLFGGGKSEQEKLAEAQMRAQIERSNRFWRQAEGDISKVRNYAAPILGGSRQAALEAMAPEIQGATARMDMGRQSLLNLGGRSGGAAMNIDPYAKAMTASSILQKARPMAANMLQQTGSTTGGWAQSQDQGGRDMAGYADTLYSRDKDQGAAMYKQMSQFADWASKDPGMQKIIGKGKGWLNKIPGFGGKKNNFGGMVPDTWMPSN